MENKKVLLIVVALMVIHGTVLAFGSKSQNSVASVSKLEMWRPSESSSVACADTTQDVSSKVDLETLRSSTDDLFTLQMLWRYMNESCSSKEDSILKYLSVTREVIDEIGFQSVDLVNKQIQLGITDAQIIKCTQTMIPLDDSIGSTNELIAPRKLYQYLDDTAVEWIQSMAPLVSNDTVCSSKDLVDLQRICHCIDARVCSQLCAESDSQTTKILMSLHRICRYIDTAIVHLLGGKLVILDTDIGSSTDDMFALQMLCRYMDAGKCRLLGVIVDRKGLDNARMAKYQLAYLGPSEVPVGIVNDYPENIEPFIDYPSLFKHQYSMNDSTDVIDAKDLYRQLLAGAPDKGVEIICVGFMTALSSLLTSQPDAISSLSGVELVEKKVQRIYIMGSDFTEKNYSVKPGYNLDTLSLAYTDTVFSLLPSSVEIMFSPGEVGEVIKYENDSVLKDIKDHDNPLWPIYDESNGVVVDSGQFMWDVLPVIQCIEGNEHFHVSEPGLVRMQTDGNGNNLIIFTPDKSSNARFQYIPSEWGDEELQKFKDYVLWLIKQSHQKGSSFQAACSKTAPKHKSIVILFENDVHCPIENYHKLAGLRDAIVLSDTAYVGIVSSGDYLNGGVVGVISLGEYIVVIMSNVKYDAIAVGNHDCDHGIERLKELERKYNLPVVCTNLFDMEDNLVFAPYKIVSYGDKKVAFVGVLTPEAEDCEDYAFEKDGQKIFDLRYEKLIKTIQRSVDTARNQGADYVVLLSHVGEKSVWGAKTHRKYPSSYELIKATTGINVVLDGHTHSVVPCAIVQNKVGHNVYISQTGSNLNNVGKLVISPKGHISIELIPTESIPYSNARVAYVTDSINALVDAATLPDVYHTDFTLVVKDKQGVWQVRKEETNAGDIATDALRWHFNADIGCLNAGAIRNNIQPGDFTDRQVKNMLIAKDVLVKIKATGAEILEMLRLCTKEMTENNGSFPQVSGLRFSVRVSDHTITSAEVLQADGSYSPICPTAYYTVATLDYCVFRNGFQMAFANCPVIEESNMNLPEVFEKYIAELYSSVIPPQYAKPQGRITIE